MKEIDLRIDQPNTLIERVSEILNKLRLLGNCSNKANYHYTEEQTRKIFS